MSLEELFKSFLNEGLSRLNLHISPLAQNYIGSLLIFYIQSDSLFEIDQSSGKKVIKPLAEIYLKAQEAPLNEKLLLLRQIGDRTLYLGGFFRESLNRKIANLNYFLNMGQGAYESLAEHHLQDETFRELSHHFTDIIDALSYISNKHCVRTDIDLMEICKKYLRTGSKVAACQLEDYGFLVQKNHEAH